MSIKRIYSAGGIVIKKVSKVSKVSDVSNGSNGSKDSKVSNDVLVLVTQHSKHKGWDFPKGHVELGETSEQAAIREVAEETGVKAEILEKVGKTEYFYWESGEKVLKTVVFFLMKFVADGSVTTPEEVSGIVWLPADQVEQKLTFKDTKKLWGEARKLIEK